MFKKQRIVLILKRLYSNDKTAITCRNDLNYLLGLLNSKAVDYFMLFNWSTNRREVIYGIQADVHFAIANKKNRRIKSKEKSNHGEIITLVTSLITLHQQLPQAHTDFDKERLTRHIESADQRIDELVYELYGLTDEEIKIVEGSV